MSCANGPFSPFMFSCFCWLDIHSDIVGFFMLLLVDSAFIWFTVYVDDLSFLVLEFGFSLGDAGSLSMLVTCLFWVLQLAFSLGLCFGGIICIMINSWGYKLE